MLNSTISESMMEALRAGIKARYQQYHRDDRDRFPDFAYNTNRANYKPLQDSFREEFFVVRGLESSAETIRIPSTNTLALLFTDANYVPSKKLLHTCQSYAVSDAEAQVLPPDSQLQQPARENRWEIDRELWRLSARRVLFVVGLLAVLVTGYVFLRPVPTNLLITRPENQVLVPQELIVEGTVLEAETVWLAVHPKGSSQYWIQPPIKVQTDGAWIGVIYVGSLNKEDGALPFEIRAFVNPAESIKSGEVYYSWPDAELKSSVLDVIRQQ